MAARIVLAVRESQYIEPLLHYLHHSEYGEMLRITAFSRKDAFIDFMRGEDIPDAVVGDSSFIEAWLIEGKNMVPWAVLSEDGGYLGKSAKSLAGGVMIAKYQALPSLLGAFLQLCEVQRGRGSSVLDETLLLGVVSSSGNMGKTTIALNMAKQLGEMGLSVFYLNLESVDSSGLFLRIPAGHTPGLERLLYEIKASRDKGEADTIELGQYFIRYDHLRTAAFRPVINVKEMLQMTMEDTLDLLERLVAERNFDVVIVDTGSIEEERAKAVLQRSRILLWVLKNDDVSMYKTMRWLSHCNTPNSGMTPHVMDKSRFVVNFAGNRMEEWVPPEGISIEGVCPFIQSWTLQHREELFLNSPQFQREILQLCKRIVEPELPLVFTGKNLHE
ncbi:hypothetical protein [Paenibacillus odorifer]|uniref:CobQ/CobB/MinD/ParA nucleotide binding domain-containing protein n=1 Tax=Paenibacillus odorifer TaxID=189426 RepID=A0A1R0Y5N8_9BACL|nr:hypothetical protein [Paenibacillus odorifer]OMD42645.1 hypothetical protein BSK52_07540 [Paenibacillus odorifer]